MKSQSTSPIFLVIVSSFFLILCFPKFNLGWLAWVALVPALSAIQTSKNYREAFFTFYAVGFIFYLVSMEWIRHVTYFGWLVVVTFLAVYYGIFGVASHFFMTRRCFGRCLLALPAFWVVLEWIRTEIPNWSLGWNLLAYSQSDYLPVARLASFIGAYGVSFSIVFANCVVFLSLSFIKEKISVREMARAISAIGALVLVLTGLARLPTHSKTEAQRNVLISVAQGNIPQNEKWDPEYRKSIVDRYVELSKLAAVEKPDLIIWPEAAWPGILNEDPEKDQILALAKSVKIPFLIGSLYLENKETLRLRQQKEGSAQSEAPESASRGEMIFNSTYLINDSGTIESRYDKIRLVPFGEYIPWAPAFRLLGLEKYAYSFGVGDFTHGHEYTIFSLLSLRDADKLSPPEADAPLAQRQSTKIASALNVEPRNDIKFSALICYEDIFPSLAREFVKRGAEFLVVVTNDAWYQKSAATYQHLQASIFRAIENGVPVVRAANIGVSGFISKDGEVLAKVKDKEGNDSWIAGGLAMQIQIGTSQTFYSQYGHFFPALCLGLLSLLLITAPPRLTQSK